MAYTLSLTMSDAKRARLGTALYAEAAGDMGWTAAPTDAQIEAYVAKHLRGIVQSQERNATLKAALVANPPQDF